MSTYPQAESNGVSRTKILMLGLRRSGKTSIREVLFNGMTPKETFYLDATMSFVRHTYDTIIPLEIWDCPGNITVETLGVPLSVFSTLVFVIDIRDLYNQPISRLVEFIIAAYHYNPSLNFEIFVHKAEKLQEDEKIENFRQINERVTDRLMDVSPSLPSSANINASLDTSSNQLKNNANSNNQKYSNWQDFLDQQFTVNFYLTSIFDHSLHQAFSKVLQRLSDSLPYLEELLNIYCVNSQAFKVFLFDAPSRLYVASDASPVDAATYNLCSDNLAMINAFGAGLYRSASASPIRRRRGNPEPSDTTKVSSVPPTPPPSAVSVNGESFPIVTSSTASSSTKSSSPKPPTSRKSTGTSGKSRSSSSMDVGTSTPPVPGSTLSLTSPSPSSISPTPSSAATAKTTKSKTNAPTTESIPPPLNSAQSQKVRIQTPQDLFYPCGATSLQPSSVPSSYPMSSAGATTIMWHLLTTGEVSLVEEAGLISPPTSFSLESSNPWVKSKATISGTNSMSTFTTYKNPTLVLLVLLPTAVWETRRGLVELNVIAVREGVQEIVDLEREGRGTRIHPSSGTGTGGVPSITATLPGRRR
ncbi:Gtr1/RagA G protein conserved region-domain-containing protein [Lentinula raphanica]|uniref:Gtr1/RagA G protein conserved region-domain-containing protein n=1 Tax=Lentinula raphanica TaxID=153919 RepID=A0AA38P040_9AGAR|nr:Gtr1/RagA G protein conserved region-domain-containing protein [Lentinula raphanica]KAJ3833843.1 Gtr1/RagA G protein conserved region-domain-containing protein [Lentinula raphanica]